MGINALIIWRRFHGFSEIMICQFLENTFRGLYANVFKKPTTLNKSFV